MALLGRVNDEFAKKRPQIKKENQKRKPSPAHYITSRSTTMGNLYELRIVCCSYLACSDYYPFANLKKRPSDFNEEIIAETKTKFEAWGESFSKEGIEMLGKRWKNRIRFKEIMLTNQVVFCVEIIVSCVASNVSLEGTIKCNKNSQFSRLRTFFVRKMWFEILYKMYDMYVCMC